MNEEAKNSLSTKTMVFGIIAIALCETGLLGLIFGAIALSNAKKYAAANDGVVNGKAKVGKILGTIGLIFGIIMMVVWAIYAIIALVAIIGGGAAAAGSGALQDLFNSFSY